MPEGLTAQFNPNAAIENILTRVTGTNPSEIFGTLSVDGDANLWLMNPNGIVFGENASLDISGSFYATTADAISLGEEAVFSAVDPQSSSLLAIDPGVSFLSYLNSNSGDITNNAALTVAPGETLTLSGNTLQMNGDLTAPAGNIVLETPQADGNFVQVNGANVNTDVPNGSNSDGGDVRITTHDLTVDSRGTVSASTFGEGDAGAVRIQATGDVTVQNDTSRIRSNVIAFNESKERASGGVIIEADNLFVRNSGIVATNLLGTGNTGQVQIHTSGDVLIDNAFIFSEVRSTLDSTAMGNSGGIAIETTNLSVLNDASVNTNTQGEGDSGAIQILATDVTVSDMTINEQRSLIRSQVDQGAEGNSGGVSIVAANLEVLDGARIVAPTNGNGDSGPVAIVAMGTVVIDGSSAIASNVNEDGMGNSSGVFINTNTLLVSNGGDVLAITNGVGNAGQVQIEANDVVVDGQASVIGSQVNVNGQGDGDGVAIMANTLSVRNGAIVDSALLGEGNLGLLQIKATEEVLVDNNASMRSLIGEDAVGNSNGISITTNNLLVSNSANIFAITNGEGNLGQVEIMAMENVALSGPNSFIASTVSLSAHGHSDGVSITTPNLLVRDGAEVSTNLLGEGSLGLLQIEAPDEVLVNNNASIQSLIGEDAVGNSDGISITTNNLSVNNSADIRVSTSGDGTAGPLMLQSSDGNDLDVVLSEGSRISAVTNSQAEGSDLTISSGGNLTIQGLGTVTVESLDADTGRAISFS